MRALHELFRRKRGPACVCCFGGPLRTLRREAASRADVALKGYSLMSGGAQRVRKIAECPFRSQRLHRCELRVMDARPRSLCRSTAADRRSLSKRISGPTKGGRQRAGSYHLGATDLALASFSCCRYSSSLCSGVILLRPGIGPPSACAYAR